MHTKEAAGGRFPQARIGANRILNLKAFLQLSILSENQDRIAVFKDGFRLDGEIQSAVSPDGNDVDAVFFRISISPTLIPTQRSGRSTS